jgi:hypothetical protein
MGSMMSIEVEAASDAANPHGLNCMDCFLKPIVCLGHENFNIRLGQDLSKFLFIYIYTEIVCEEKIGVQNDAGVIIVLLHIYIYKRCGTSN